jgi:hypothetical protein
LTELGRSRFAVGTARLIGVDASEWCNLVARGTIWLLKNRNLDGTWGSDDGLDRLISTNHALMTLLCVGFPPDAVAVAPGLKFLADIDTERHISFFWRSGVLLNIPEYHDIVVRDINYIWSHRRRIGVHRDYPVPFFLLKLLRFIHDDSGIGVKPINVLRWILEEWDPSSCWFGRTSITSMALALIYDMDFPERDEVVTVSVAFLENSYRSHDSKRGSFSANLVDDSFTVYNLCETDFLKSSHATNLCHQVEAVAAWLAGSVLADGSWRSDPPFGGTVGASIYPTAVAMRALAACGIMREPHFPSLVAARLLDQDLIGYNDFRRAFEMASPFWGQVTPGTDEETCFVLMPFSPDKLTEIYEEYIVPVHGVLKQL